MDDELRDVISGVYNDILQTANKILENCKLFSIEVLQQEDPSYEQIAEHLHEVCKLIEIVYDGHPEDAEAFRLLVKAREYTVNVENIAGAIRLGSEELLDEYIKELNRRPFV